MIFMNILDMASEAIGVCCSVRASFALPILNLFMNSLVMRYQIPVNCESLATFVTYMILNIVMYMLYMSSHQ